jgi:hypothetical protein
MIRAQDILNSIPLNERNMYDTEGIDNWIEYLARKQDVDEIKTWLESKFRKYVINDYPGAELLTEVPTYADDWLKKALERGEEVYSVDNAMNMDGNLADLAYRLTSFLDEICPSREFFKFVKMPVQDLIRKEEDYRAKRLRIEGVEVEYKYPDGFKWVNLLTHDAVLNDGEELANCLRVHTYLSALAIKNGKEKIFSLRDSGDRAKAMMGYDTSEDRIDQIRGFANKEVPVKYQSYCIDFLNRKKFRSVNTDELWNINATYQDGKFVSRLK